ncbi:CLUMA_CG004017, isoform B [Clunio marinus]|uniref:CLUMA_CG004017, isoform B n=1 Tax=Clunio marinus TaxID=568069 RepID=A0A1J1HUU8_9DIPT|nr:CLUMA_CG004017, isoform B [Clunio marinus]
MYCFCRSSKTISVRIIFLDETDFLHEIQKELLGQSLLEVVYARLNLLETAYFGLRYLDFEGQTHWLDANTRLSRQLKENKDIYELYFSVKFYAVDPCKLVEEITRYQFYLQLKQDVLQGRLPVTFDTASQLGAYVIQSEIGDYDSAKHTHGYVSEFRFVPNQTKDLEFRIAEIHKQLKGVEPAQAEFNFLDKVKWLDMYGVDLHPVLGEDSVEYFLGLTPSGIIVLRNKSTVAHYYWPRIAKVYFKGRYFMIRVCDKNNEVSTYGFETPKKTACKHLWKCCVEHHAFFRLIRVSPVHPQTGAGDFFSFGSRFRYSSGRTERQASKEASNINRVPPTFTRRPSRRQIRRSFDTTTIDKTFETDNNRKLETKSISVPQPACTIDSAYRSTCSIPATFNNNNTIHKYNQQSTPDSPRSTRSAGWIKSQQRGLFGINSSPKSVRSASSRNGNATNGHRQRSSSVESQSSNDSRSGRRHRSRSKRISDNESEMSRGSGRSGRSHRKHRRHRSRNRESSSELGGTRDYNHNEQPALVDSGKQWLEVQRKQAEITNMGTVQQASVVKSNAAPKSTNSTDTYNRNKKNRKHRSPTDSRSKIWSSELTKHLQFDLVDTSGMTEDQLKEIPYTVVETSQNRKRNNTNSLKVHKSAYGKDRVDRIRGPQVTADGSIRSGSTNSSSQDFDRANGLNRMMSSLSMGEFVNSSNLNRIDYAGIRVSHEHTDSGLGDQDYAYSSERSSDSAKYTNKSSGTSVLSGNINTSSFHSKFYSGNHQRETERQSHGSINHITAPSKTIGEMSTEL